MNYITMLDNLLTRYINEYYENREKYHNDMLLKDLYDQLLAYLSDRSSIEDNKMVISLLFSNIYPDNIYLDEFYRIFNIKDSMEFNKRIKKLYSDINGDYIKLQREIDILGMQIYRNKYNVNSARSVKLCFKYNMPINQNKFDISNVKKIINYFEVSGVISNRDELLLINEIENYNRIVSTKDDSLLARETSLYNDVPNIVLSGYQEHDSIDVDDDRRLRLEQFIEEIYNVISVMEEDKRISFIEDYKKYNIEDNEYSYIVVGLLDKYLDELMTLYKMLMDKELYKDRNTRVEISDLYYENLNKYLFLRKYYEDTVKYISDEEIEEVTVIDESLEDENSQNKNVLIYSHNKGNIKGKILSDMKDVPFEYYDKVLYLINSFKDNNVAFSQRKVLATDPRHLKYSELKDDQIRIVFKHLKENIFCVMGVFVKKDTNDRNAYVNMKERNIPNISSEEKYLRELQLAELTENELEKLVSEKARKGTR